MMKVGIDFGRGEVKAMIEGGNHVRFVSVLGEPVKERFKSLVNRVDRNGHIRARIINRNGHEWAIDRMVGSEALLQSEAVRAELVADRKQEDILALVAEAFLQGGVDGDVQLVCGAPVDYYQRVRTRWVVDKALIAEEASLRQAGTVSVEAMSKVSEGETVHLLGTVREIVPGGCILEDNSGTVEVRNSLGTLEDQWRGKRVLVSGTATTVGPYRDLLCGQWNVNEVVYPNVVAVAVLPEPAGTVYGVGLGLDGSTHLDELQGTVAVIDVGTFTTDCVLFTDLSFRENHSFSIPMGMSYVLTAIKQFVRDKTGKDAPYFAFSDALQRGSVFVDGRPVDLGDVIDNASGYLAESVLSAVQSRWERVLDIQRLLVVGGGAYYIFNAIRGVYENAERPESPEWSNADGFLAYAIWRWRDQSRTL